MWQRSRLDERIEGLARRFPEPSHAERTGEVISKEIHPDTGEVWEPWLFEHWATGRGYTPDQIEAVGGFRSLAEDYAYEQAAQREAEAG